jgi:superfamily II DNA or RNA helicase
MAISSNAVVVREAVYVPESILVSPEKVLKAYARRMYDNAACNKCENKPERHNYVCDTCEAYQGMIKLAKRREVKGVEYIVVPVGDKSNFEKKTGLAFDEIKVVDRRNNLDFEYRVKFIAKLRSHQEELQKTFLKKKYGLIEAPPRFGKTITAISTILKLGKVALVLAAQHEYLEQFMDHIHGNEKEGIPKCTNLPELERKHKKKLYGIPKKEQDFKDFQLMFITYQSLLDTKNGRQRLKWLNKRVSTLCIDEVDQGNATEFSRVISKIASRYKFGVTGTIERKDKKHFIAKALIGPVVAKSSVEALTPTVYVHDTGIQTKRYNAGKRSWVFAMQHLCNHEKRNKMIVEQVIKDLKKGHNIVIPLFYKKHVYTLRDMINETWGSEICDVFVGGAGKKSKEERKKILAKAKQNKLRVIVGIRRLLYRGLNVPTWSCIYTVAPISNKPNYKQETRRVCTPMEGKNTPIVRIFIDRSMGQSLGCGRNCIRHCVEFGYNFSKKRQQKELVRDLLDYGKRKFVTDGIQVSDDDLDFKVYRRKG